MYHSVLCQCLFTSSGQVLSKPNSIGDWRGINGKSFKLDDHSHSFPAWRMDDIPKVWYVMSGSVLNVGCTLDKNVYI